MSVGPDRSITETNNHNKSFYLTACHNSLPHSTVACAKQQQEESAYACGRLVTQDGISVHVNPVGGLGWHVAQRKSPAAERGLGLGASVVHFLGGGHAAWYP